MRRFPLQVLLLLSMLSMGACRSNTTPASSSGAARPVQMIPLAGPVAAKSSELSRLAWHGETLVLLPQYADKASQDGAGAVYALTKVQIQDFLRGKTTTALAPRAVPFSAPSIRDKVPGFEGFESIAFSGERVFLTIESHDKTSMKGYLVAGTTDAALSQIQVDTDHIAPVSPQAPLGNMSEEALVIAGEKLFTFYEANGLNVNANPVAHQFNVALETQPSLPFPHLEYRVTDATPPDDQGRFWVINYFYPGDAAMLQPATDPLAQRWAPNLAPTHDGSVERLVQLQLTESGVALVDRAPIWLELGPSEATRNWEGIAPLGSGFLLVTDSHPQTLFGYVEAQP